MTFLDAQTDEHALDAIDRLATVPAIPFAVNLINRNINVASTAEQ
jgi:methylglyoxal synthase